MFIVYYISLLIILYSSCTPSFSALSHSPEVGAVSEKFLPDEAGAQFSNLWPGSQWNASVLVALALARHHFGTKQGPMTWTTAIQGFANRFTHWIRQWWNWGVPAWAAAWTGQWVLGLREIPSYGKGLWGVAVLGERVGGMQDEMRRTARLINKKNKRVSHCWSKVDHIWYTLWLFNIAMENGPFIDGLPIKNGDFPWLC